MVIYRFAIKQTTAPSRWNTAKITRHVSFNSPQIAAIKSPIKFNYLSRSCKKKKKGGRKRKKKRKIETEERNGKKAYARTKLRDVCHTHRSIGVTSQSICTVHTMFSKSLYNQEESDCWWVKERKTYDAVFPSIDCVLRSV